MTGKIMFLMEMEKLRRRWIPALFFLTFGIIALWLGWCLREVDPSRFNDITALVFINLLLMNTIFCPVLQAVAASRMCDMEQLGNTYKWLCTIQRPEHIYQGKVMAGSFFTGLFCLSQTFLFGMALYFIQGKLPDHMALLFLNLFLPSLCIFILQLNLSLRFTNQLTPLFFSIGGTFAGLFSWYLSQWPLRYLIPWGYYAALCSTGYTYDQVMRFTAFYWESPPVLWMGTLIAFTGWLCHNGRVNFMKLVSETI